MDEVVVLVVTTESKVNPHISPGWDSIYTKLKIGSLFSGFLFIYLKEFTYISFGRSRMSDFMLIMIFE